MNRKLLITVLFVCILLLPLKADEKKEIVFEHGSPKMCKLSYFATHPPLFSYNSNGIYLCLYYCHYCMHYSWNGKILHYFCGALPPDYCSYTSPGGIFADSITGNVYVYDMVGNCIIEYDGNCRYLKMFKLDNMEKFAFNSMFVKYEKYFYLVGYNGQNTIARVSEDGKVVRYFSPVRKHEKNFAMNESFLAVDNEGMVYQVFHLEKALLRKFDPEGNLVYEKHYPSFDCHSEKLKNKLAAMSGKTIHEEAVYAIYVLGRKVILMGSKHIIFIDAKTGNIIKNVKNFTFDNMLVNPNDNVIYLKKPDDFYKYSRFMKVK